MRGVEETPLIPLGLLLLVLLLSFCFFFGLYSSPLVLFLSLVISKAARSVIFFLPLDMQLFVAYIYR